MGSQYAIYSFNDQVIDPCNLDNARDLYSIVEAKDGKIVIPPRNFVLLTTTEYVKFPNDVIGLCNLRSTVARYGLSSPPTVIDAGFEGNVTIEIVNSSSNYIVLRPGMRFLHVVLSRTEGGAAKYSGKYLGGQRGGLLPPRVSAMSASDGGPSLRVNAWKDILSMVGGAQSHGVERSSNT